MNRLYMMAALMSGMMMVPAQVIREEDYVDPPEPKRQKPPKPQVVRLPDARQVPAAKSSSLKRLLAQKGRK